MQIYEAASMGMNSLRAAIHPPHALPLMRPIELLPIVLNVIYVFNAFSVVGTPRKAGEPTAPTSSSLSVQAGLVFRLGGLAHVVVADVWRRC